VNLLAVLHSIKSAFFLFVALGLTAPALAQTSNSAPVAIEQIATAIQKFYTHERTGFTLGNSTVATSGANVKNLLATLQADGSWPDIDYSSQDRSGWPQIAHANNILLLIVAAHDAPVTERARILAGVHRAFGFWIRHDFKCPNWWFNNIGVPKTFATAAVLMGDELLPAEKDYLLQTMMPRAKIGMTGQNRLWLAGNTLLAGIIANDPDQVQNAATVIWSEIVVTTNEGLQPDDSFHQHGPQQQFGNYGLAFADEIVRWGGFLAGTPFAMPAPKLAIFRSYLLNGLNWVVWRAAMDPGACDRQITPNCQQKKAAGVTSAMSGFARFDTAHADDYLAFVARNRPGATNDLVGDHYFYRSDALFHRLPNLFLSLKMSSKRVVGTEIVNGENKLGYHAGDGMLLAQRTGEEYINIFPLWDWKKLPGVTDAQTPLPKFNHTFVPVDFVGAASDGFHGVAAMNYERDGVSVHKAWFFGNEGVIALGAGITASVAAPVVTGVNTTLLRGPVTGEGLPAGGQGRVATPGFVEHDGLRYTFPIAENVMLATNRVTGNWKTIFNNVSTPEADVTGDIFSLNIDHGVHPADGTYAYEIGLTGEKPGAVILQNTPEIQAVRFGDGVVGIVFEAPGTFSKNGVSLTADQPCAVILGAAAKKLSVAEPTQKLKTLTLIFNGATHFVNLPQNGTAGSTVSVALNGFKKGSLNGD
jgi:chondroitin AC lyase